MCSRSLQFNASPTGGVIRITPGARPGEEAAPSGRQLSQGQSWPACSPFTPLSPLTSRWSFPLALATLAFAWPLAGRAELPEHTPDADDVLPPDYLSVTPPPLTPPRSCRPR